MNNLINKTFDQVSRIGEKIERRLSQSDSSDNLKRSGSGLELSATPVGAFGNYNNYSQQQQQVQAYGYGGGNYGNQGAYGGNYGGQFRAVNPYGTGANIGYSPDYYIAERRVVDLVPAPRPQIIRQQVPVPVQVDRPVPQPYPVSVPKPVPVDRPVPVPVSQPVLVDRPYPVAVPVPVPSPPPPPVYVPVGVPVPSPRASPVMFERKVTETQRQWVNVPPPNYGHNPCNYIP
ncbi:unnamed protein product [Didymodactylos carnosus]|uniref:Uncharacterized protein n=1 Tax=Didymodactylos carnosus TaxID=1234261 RepID=A0A815SIP0_9BILA|nr:unnamed protein product [Didymodactylos carnosus]CAF4353772.1 unnamed protein product [Didymodactylos carnosus]